MGGDDHHWGVHQRSLEEAVTAIAKWCEVREGATASHGDLYRAYVAWHRGNEPGEPMSSKAFGKKLRKNFGEPKRKQTAVTDVLVYRGIGVRVEGEVDLS